jgi:hypothetical protein
MSKVFILAKEDEKQQPQQGTPIDRKTAQDSKRLQSTNFSSHIFFFLHY